MSISITTLEKSVKLFAEMLKARGFTINEIDVFKDGTRSGMYGGSYVELNISYTDYWNTFRFYSVYDHGAITSFSGKWSEMKKKCLFMIENELSIIANCK